MGGEQTGPRRQGRQPAQRAVLQAGQGAGPLGAQQVGTAGRGHQQAAAGEDRRRLAVGQHQVAGVLGGVARGVDRADDQAPPVREVLQVEGGGVAVGGRRGGGQHQFGPGAQGGLLGARDVVVVQVGLQHEPQFHVPLGDDPQEPVDVALGVDEHPPALVDQQVALVTETRSAERHDLHFPAPVRSAHGPDGPSPVHTRGKGGKPCGNTPDPSHPHPAWSVPFIRFSARASAAPYTT